MKNLLLSISLIMLFIFIACDTKKDKENNVLKTEMSESIEQSDIEKQSQATMQIAMKFMGAMGKGDMETMTSLMHDDMVWHNEGDKELPWIGPWNGKKTILEEFLPKFGANLKTTKWEQTDGFASGDTAAFFGKMKGILTNSGLETKEFTYALRVKVKDGKVILWNWFEDSYEISKAYHKIKS